MPTPLDYARAILRGEPLPAFTVTENGGKTRYTCCEYSVLRAEELEASAKLARAIRAKIDGDTFAEMLLELVTSAKSKGDRKAAVRAIVMLLERVPVRADLRRRLLVEMYGARS